MNKAPPASKLGRTAITGLALAQAGASKLGHKARQMLRSDDDKQAAQEQHEAELGRILFKALNQLKGSALKVSQLLSMEADFLPEGIRRELAKGCHQVTPLNRALIHKVFQREFGQAPEHLYAQFDAHAFAAASLGQVHHAQLADGLQLAVKVQYPGIAAAIGSDLRMLRGIFQTMAMGTTILPRKEVIDRFMNELEVKLGEELDYEHEAAQLHWFGQHVNLPGIVIPKCIDAMSSKRILTMEKLDGLHLDAWLATAPDQAQRNHFGQLLFDWFWFSVCQLGRVHADPHPGNFLFMPDGRLAVLDFGCTNNISSTCSNAMASSWRALLMTDETERNRLLRLAYIDLGLFSDAITQDEFDTGVIPALAELHAWKIEAFQSTHFDFSNKSPYPKTINVQHSKVLAGILAGWHEDVPYFDRAYLGLMNMLKKMGAIVNTNIAWTRQGTSHVSTN
ncbi:AarF/ABC1/UbiB kinase family protein [Undibacterium sp. CY18W]|uniref:AarF/ABC1/UbiB kinase family protein n=1 Tax=Undibacterium hunanense TaxID=2762292 RepID=A0ABR6ZYT4_9BURK|nr:AarF/ABC1/UbiB kinase family protein [Undibacterium hunanense]MBC3921048.1 AarF/ABC1/UbiB kinase family protein [Undibacterium hunanense]